MIRAFLLGALLLLPLASAEGWPTAHGGPSNQRAAPSALTPETVGDLERAWRVPTQGGVTGTPVHADGVAYFASWGGLVHAVDIESGTQLWRVDHGTRVDASLAIVDDKVLVADAEGNLTARERATGEVVWRTWVEPKRGVHLWGSPAVHDGRIYIGIASEQTDVTYEGVQDFRGGVAALDAATGEILWKTYTQPPEARGVSVWSTPALDPELGLLYVGSGNAYGAPAGSLSDALIALRMADGAVAWSYQATPDDTFNARGAPGPDADIGASPILFEIDGRPVVADGDKGGRFFALDRRTGELLWRVKADFVGDLAPAEKEGFLGTAAYADGVIFAPTTARSMVHAIDARTGDFLWARELNEKPRAYGDRMFAPTSVTNGVVMQGNAFGQLHLLDARDGSTLRVLDVGGDVQGGVSIADGYLLVPDSGDVVWGPTGNLTAYRFAAASEGSPAPTPVASSAPVAPTPSPDIPPLPTPSPTPEQLPTVVVGEKPETGAKIAPAPGPAFALALSAAIGAAAWRARSRP